MIPHRVVPSLVAACLGLTAAACASSAEPEVVAHDSEPFSSGLSGEPVHEDITAAGLDFLKPAVLLAVQQANVAVDVEFALVSAHHVDDCNFTGAAEVIRAYQDAAVAALDPLDPLPIGDAAAIAAFGSWLHTVQDFYAHSNWVELGGPGLVDASLARWPAWSAYASLTPTGYRLVQGDPPAGTSVARPSDAAYPESALVSVTDASRTIAGVVTGTVDYEPGDFCPPSASITHADLNKDHSATAGRESEFVTAKALAIAQTRHEWCRFSALTRAAWGDAGAARLATWVADPTRAQCDGATP